MGQKINLLTLRPLKLPFNNINSNVKESIFVYSFLKLLEFFFWQKKLFLTNTFFFIFQNKIFFTFFIFFRVAKLNLFYGKKYKKLNLIENFNKKSNNNLNLMFNSLKNLKKNLIIYKIVNLNKNLKKKKIKNLYFFLKREAQIIFPRRHNFFLDFLQLTLLFIENKIKITFFIKIIVEMFRILQKKRHGRFLGFITMYFKSLIANKSYKKFNTILGIKIIISGKLKGKPRSNTFNKTFGSVPIQTLNSIIEYSKSHAFTIYGVFGIKIWVFRKIN